MPFLIIGAYEMLSKINNSYYKHFELSTLFEWVWLGNFFLLCALITGRCYIIISSQGCFLTDYMKMQVNVCN